MAFTDRIYIVKWNKLATWIVPPPLRTIKTLGFVCALIAGVADLYERFLSYKDYTVYWLGINSQVCYMERALNDKYDVTGRRIEIVDGIAFNALPLYLKNENKPVTLYKKGEGNAVVLYTKNETALFVADFIVKVPADVPFNEKEMRAFIDTFKTPSKTYIIQKV